MPRGTPDGRIVDTFLASQVTDLGAVYSMLWGFSPIDGQGRVMYFDTFNNGLHGWTKSTAGAGAVAPVLSSPENYVFSPPNCVICNPGIIANSQSYIVREMYAGKATRIGLEAGFNFNSGIQPGFQVDYNPNEGLPYLGRIRFEQSTGAWSVRTPGGVNSVFFTPGAPPANMMLMQVKIVMDFATGKYVRAYIGDQDFDISALSMDSSSSMYNGFMSVNMGTFSKGAGAGAMQLGYVLVTKDEP